MIQISIIVPIYNAEQYLRECLDSLTRQGFTKDNAEVLLINDGSTDESEKIATEYCFKYNFFHLINKVNGGVSSSRNTGLRFANGKYISFIDADDLVAPDIYLQLCSNIDSKGYNGVFFYYSKNKISLDCYDPSIKYLRSDYPVKSPVWMYIYENKIIQTYKLSFDESLKCCEDRLFNYQYCEKAKDIGLYPKKLYFYRVNDFSIMNKCYLDDNYKMIDFESNLYVAKTVYKTSLNKQNKYGRKTLSLILCNVFYMSYDYNLHPRIILKKLKNNGLSFKLIRMKDLPKKTNNDVLKMCAIYFCRYYVFFILAYKVLRILKYNKRDRALMTGGKNK